MLVGTKKQIYVYFKAQKLTLQQQRMNTFLRYLELFYCDQVRIF